MLIENRKILETFIQNAPSSMAMFDNAMRYLEASPRWLAEFGLEGRNLTGLSHYDVFPEITAKLREVHRRALAGEILHSEGESFKRMDGTEQWLRWEIRPWHDGTGGIGGVVIFSEDITERKQTENALRVNLERLNFAHEAAQSGCWEWDLQTNESLWSEELWDLYGIEGSSCDLT